MRMCTPSISTPHPSGARRLLTGTSSEGTFKLQQRARDAITHGGLAAMMMGSGSGNGGVGDSAGLAAVGATGSGSTGSGRARPDEAGEETRLASAGVGDGSSAGGVAHICVCRLFVCLVCVFGLRVWFACLVCV